MAKATLLVIQGVDQGMRFEIRDEPVGIGRGIGNAIRILDTEVSRMHATIECAEGEYFIADQNSSNGTYVNGLAIERKKLVGGDQIQFGRTVFLFSDNIDTETIQQASDRIDLIGRQEPRDLSRIVDEVGHDFGSGVLPEQAAQQVPETAQMLAHLQVLYRISEFVVSPTISLDQLLRRILDLTIDVVGADRGCVLLSNPDSGALNPQVVSHRKGFDSSDRMPVSTTIVDYVIANGQGVRTTDARTDDRFDTGQSILQAGIREAICVPLQGRYELMGVIYVDTTTTGDEVVVKGQPASKFTEEKLRLTLAIGRQSALAVEDHRYQQAFVHAERLAAVGQTIATLSHHIKNILQGVRGGSYLIDMGLKDHNEDLIGKGWNIVEKNQNKIYHLVMDMLTFSKERQPAMKQTVLQEVIEDVCELMSPRAEDCGVRLTWQTNDNIPPSFFDPEAMHRAVLNIVVNAIDAVEGIDGGCVELVAGFKEETDQLYVEVSDNGPGIPADQVATIFNIFESTKGARGTGLGLAVSQKILREHGGEIFVNSEVGQGSRFELSWPRHSEESDNHDVSTNDN